MANDVGMMPSKDFKAFDTLEFFVKVSHFFFNEKLASAFDRVFFFFYLISVILAYYVLPEALVKSVLPLFYSACISFYGSGSKKVLYLCDVLVW